MGVWERSQPLNCLRERGSSKHDLVESFASQLSAGRTLSKKQNAALTDIEAKVKKRRSPSFVSGGF